MSEELNRQDRGQATALEDDTKGSRQDGDKKKLIDCYRMSTKLFLHMASSDQIYRILPVLKPLILRPVYSTQNTLTGGQVEVECIKTKRCKIFRRYPYR